MGKKYAELLRLEKFRFGDITFQSESYGRTRLDGKLRMHEQQGSTLPSRQCRTTWNNLAELSGSINEFPTTKLSK